MGYMQMGDLPSSDWNSTKYPGVCKPTNFGSLGIFKELQKQLNRVAHALGLNKIGVDGDIGPGTMSLLTQIKPRLNPLNPVHLGFMGAPTSCAGVAGKADSLGPIAKSIADGLGVSSTISQPAPSRPPTIITPGGAELVAPPGSGLEAGLWDKVKSSSTTAKLAIGVALLVAGVYAGIIPMGKKKRK